MAMPSLSPTVLGLNMAYHQPSACIVRDGIVVAAAEEERFNRIKGGKSTDVDNTLVMPFRAIDFVLEEIGLRLDQVDWIANSFDPERRLQSESLFRKHNPILDGRYETPEGDRAFRNLLLMVPEILAARYNCDAGSLRARFRWVPHHVAHLAGSYYASPFERAAGLVLDGIGEADTTSIGRCAPDRIEILESIDYPHSLGSVWEVLTNFLGFQGNHDECKIMGLAAYGDPRRFESAVDSLVQVDDSGRFRIDIHPGVLHGDYAAIEALIGFPRRLPYEPLAWEGRQRCHADLAATLQTKTNDIFLKLARKARQMTGLDFLVMAGGVTLNCVANGRVAEESGFKDVFIQPAAGDGGTSVGAALKVFADTYGIQKGSRSAMPTAFLGPEFSDAQIEAALERHRLPKVRLDDPVEDAVSKLAEGKIIAWFQGRMEFGPRALGNRSLLANPNHPGIRQVLNLFVKHREPFRPFCPSVLAEHADEWFLHEMPFCQAARFMLATYQVRPEKFDLVSATTHLDGSSRLQIVTRADNPLFHELISQFHARTGIPLLLNTSFNDREPIVATPDDACRTWLKTRFDAMYLGPYRVEGLKPWERSPELSAYEREVRRFDTMGSEGPMGLSPSILDDAHGEEPRDVR